ncbi:MAG: hypothetical protein ACI8W3_001772 [Myxococcota bacterium]|jgi:hypothetical protein
MVLRSAPKGLAAEARAIGVYMNDPLPRSDQQQSSVEFAKDPAIEITAV